MSERILIDGIMVSPCVGCGFCCIKTPCDVSRRVYGAGIRDCPGLEWNGERYVCNLCTKDILGERYREELYIGKGCCCNLNSWRKEVIPRRDQDLPQSGIVSLDPLFQKFLFSMGREMLSGDKTYLMLATFQDLLKRNGKSENEIKSISKAIVHCLRNNRPSYMDEFMGKL